LRFRIQVWETAKLAGFEHWEGGAQIRRGLGGAGAGTAPGKAAAPRMPADDAMLGAAVFWGEGAATGRLWAHRCCSEKCCTADVVAAATRTPAVQRAFCEPPGVLY